MNLMIVVGTSVLRSFCSRMLMSIVSNAFDMSSDVMIVRFGGFLWLKPLATVLFI